MAQSQEMKWVLNTVSGLKREVGPNIYNNPFRMRAGNWELIEAPVEFVKHEPVMVNVPGFNPDISLLKPSQPAEPMTYQEPVEIKGESLPLEPIVAHTVPDGEPVAIAYSPEYKVQDFTENAPVDSKQALKTPAKPNKRK